MAKRKQLFHPDEVKQKIQASQLINRLQDHVFSDEPTMDGTQVTAALKLLGKVVPDLKAVEHTGPGKDGEFLHKIERVIVKAPDPNA
ncbi:hypothetical protein [Phaeobacter italicus]|jgi:hypothetical protein|uniref:hypothetical protein n=1 Tax=Phaeobacter italicus TaxID=481446 RepID=UPI001CD22D69|nr:hypothetical protein [Phaeobacter italicus]MCA0856146.1 hypothetical protein [Phaeobacter italicus]